jgi:hypothetical protein
MLERYGFNECQSPTECGDTTMDYETALQATVSRETAIGEIERHYCDAQASQYQGIAIPACETIVSEFLEEVGDKPFYSGSEVLYWLGY